MLQQAKEKFTLSIIESLAKYETKDLNTGKRLISVIAGVYMLQKGIRSLSKHTFRGIEEIALGGVLLFSATSGLNKKIIKKPLNPSDVRRNQIQGNDPKSGVPAFV
ncbi:hypothetical protein FBD94_20860 [Pedobacter hiemivivus]|uniref:Uncharacterized protein n=1 Tax=Pedobacter hiemivivus TaxID=2530454 RepID=A0A4R0MGZ9_9SPHI|nr:hypothetical protein [Pedobacter hiemivivus]TCC85779.1 hypothetical protein EZ444_24900 [Pedobacter hiemivivus]TKC57726.1 hypothetical protein FBD94_20860 [Pedobacter hiemivivus]